jgi:Domain of unknown function (DUF1707)
MDDRFRISDAGRDRAIALLRDHFAAGRLTASELDERLTAALQAKTSGDVRRVLAGLPGPAPVPQRAGGLPPQGCALARGYRRLLVFYPARFRRVHQEEMLAVLMTAAPSGTRRPGIAEAVDLILGALRVRLQPTRDAEPAWRDALAVVSVIVPVVILLTSAVQETQMLLSFPASVPGPSSDGFPLWVLKDLAPPLAIVALVLLALRQRRVAVLAAVALLIWLVSGLPSQGVGLAVGGASFFLALGLEIAALTVSPGPRRGLQLLTWKHRVLVVIAALAAGTSVIPVTSTVRLIVLAVICAAMALSSSLGRWLLVLLAIPAYPFFVDPFSPPGLHIGLAYLPPPLAVIAPAYLPPLALLVVAVVAARRESLRSSCFPPASR